jgi:hypothetical protein
MELALRGIGDTTTVTINPSADVDYSGVVTQDDLDALNTSILGSATPSPLGLTAPTSTAVAACPSGQTLSGGLCVAAFMGIPVTTLAWIGVAVVGMVALKGKR